jgi:hypothetical protein
MYWNMMDCSIPEGQ